MEETVGRTSGCGVTKNLSQGVKTSWKRPFGHLNQLTNQHSKKWDMVVNPDVDG